MRRPVYRALASAVVARLNCINSGNAEWRDRHEDTIRGLVKNHLPSGSGVDNGSTIYLERCSADRLVLAASFHHMNERGYYDGWTDHQIIVTPSFDGIDLRITGRNRNEIKDYLGDLFHHALTAEIEP